MSTFLKFHLRITFCHLIPSGSEDFYTPPKPEMIYDADKSPRQSEPHNEPESLPGYFFCAISSLAEGTLRAHFIETGLYVRKYIKRIRPGDLTYYSGNRKEGHVGGPHTCVARAS